MLEIVLPSKDGPLGVLNILSIRSPRYKTLCSEPGGPPADMQISEAAGGAPQPGAEPCRFPKLEECAHFHYERVQLPPTLQVSLQTSMDQSLHSQHTNEDLETEWFMVQVTSGEECWLVQRNFENFQMLDEQLHQCIFDRKISQLPDLLMMSCNEEELEQKLAYYLERFSRIADNSVNCGPVLNWLQMDNKGHRLLVPSEESRSINTPAVAAAYSVRRYVSQARDELNLEVGDMISVIDMASPGESMWWRGKRGFQVGFFPQHCVHIIGDKVPRNMPLPPPVVGSLALSPVKPVLRRHGKLITFFRSFILNRPSRRRLKQSGILKERVFGCDLGEHLLNSGRDVPTVLRSCAEFIETQGIVDGIYRLSGITSNIQKLRNAFDEDRIPDLYTEDILKDIHSVASLLKMYFRELPNPLCTYQLYQSFVNAVQGCSTATRSTETDHERLLKMREAVQKLPPPHYRTLEYLMRHLARVANHSSSTGMTTRNLAIVWAPNLLRCEALEVGGVAALQGVGVQAVVTEFLICYADLIFCDHLPSIDQPELAEKENLMAKKCRPNSLAISTPTKLITLEEARNKHLTNKSEDCNYIEVGGGPSNLPKKYHTIIELPPGARKRGHTKRSPLGWRMFFTRSSRSAPQGAVTKNRKVSTPISINDKSVTESDLTDMRRKLRTVKSAESLTSGHSEPVSTEDILGPLYSLNKPPGHNRSVSHDSYFDTLQSSQNNSEGSLLDLSEIHLNFDLEESEMRIFSEDESLVSSPRIQKDLAQRRILTRARPEDFASATNSVNPSPKKQARVVLSPESMSRKRTRLEDQLSDIQYIDCSTPDNIVSTTAVVHAMPASPEDVGFSEPKNKSPRNSDNLDNKRQSLNLEPSARTTNHPMTKSFTDLDLGRQFLAGGGGASLLTPTPTSPGYKQLGESSANTTPGYSPTLESSSSEITYQHLGGKSDGGGDSPKKAPRCGDGSPNYENILPSCGGSPNYENILTTISITYKSPPRSPAASSPMKSPVYENVILNPEKVDIPTSTASLPIQEASQPDICNGLDFLTADKPSNDRPKSLSALEDAYNSSTDSTLKANSSGAICNTSEQLSLTLSLNDQRTEASSNQSSGSNIQYTASLSSAPPYHFIENSDRLSPTDLSLSEVVQSSTENLTTSRTSISTPISPSKNSLSPNVSPTTTEDSRLLSNENLLRRDDDVWTVPRPTSINLIDFSPQEAPNSPSRTISQNDKRKSDETESYDENAIYQQVKYFRRSIHEVNALLDMDASAKTPDSVDNSVEYDTKQNTKEDHQKVEEEPNFDSLEDDGSHAYENVKGESLRHTEHLVIGPARTEDAGKTDETCKEVMREDPVEERCNVKDLKSRFEVKGTNMESGARCSIVTKDNTKPSSVPLRKTSLAESDNSDKNLDRSLTEENSLSLTSNSNTSNRVVRTSVGDKGDSDHKHHSDRSSTEPTTTNTTTTNTGSSNITSTTTSNHSRLGGSISSSNKDHSSTDEKLTDEKLATDDKLIDRSLTDDTNTSTTSSNSLNRLRVFYEKDSLPPCLRARNLKNQMKTRSLDEEEFEKECGGLDKVNERRKSLDESIGYKTNSLPKTLNQPKSLPKDENGQMESLHLSHSNEKINLLGVTGVGKEDEAQKKRERIDKYKEERRRILSEKYRSESFKEDKDVLLSRLKIYKGKEEAIEDGLKMADGERPPRSRRKSTKSESESMNETRVSEERARNSSGSSPGKNNNPAKTITPSPARSLSSLTTIPTTIIPTTNHRPPRDPELAAPVTVPKPDPPKPPKTTSSLKVRAAIFEQQNAKAAPVTVEFVRSNRASLRGEKAATTMAEVEVSKFARNSLERKKEQQERGVEKPPISRAVDKSSSIIGDKPSMISSEDIPGDLKDLEFIRHRRREDDVSKEERRRHTYETRERETDAERLRRVSLESKNSPRKEKASPTYCIKDMKAIFESKSKQ